MNAPEALRNLLPRAIDYLPHLSVDCVIFGYKSGQLYVLVAEIDLESPVFTLPGGFVGKAESIDTAARRVLEKRTGVSDIYLEQFRVFGAANRARNNVVGQLIAAIGSRSELNVADYAWMTDRFVSIGYYALVNMEDVTLRPSSIDRTINWYSLEELPDMFLDHRDITLGALEALRLSLDRKLIGFNLLPQEFTMRDLQELYEAVYDQTYVRANFQKRMLRLNVLERLGKKYTGASNKAPYLYRFIEDNEQAT